MATLSIPVSTETSQRIKHAIQNGWGNSITDIGRTAINQYLDDLAVAQVLKAAEEPSLCGDLDDLASKL